MPLHTFGWKKDRKDERDLKFSVVHHPHLAELPERVDLSAKMPPVFDQGALGSCTANALCGALGFLQPGFIGSRLQVYYCERELEGTVDQDAGAEIRDGVKVLASTGAAPEADWPYDIHRFTVAPPARILAIAAAHKISSYSRLETEEDFRQCLAAGFPFVIGFECFSALDSGRVADTGCLPLPDYDTPVIGGHAVCVTGYDRHSPAGDAFLVRNSWGEDWGLKGNFWIPFAYLTHPDLAWDAWTLRGVGR